MKFTLSKHDKIIKFSTIFRHLQCLVDAVKIYFSDNGLYIQGVDNSSCCLFECQIPSGWFDEYSFNEGIDASQISVNTAIMQKVIGTLGDKQNITMSYEGGSDILKVEFSKGTVNFNKIFEIALIDLDVELLTIPKHETLVDLVIQTNKFSELITQLSIFSEILTLQFTDEAISFKASGVEGCMKSSIELEDVTEYAIGEDSELTHSYSLKYMSMMCNFNKLSKDIVMGFNDNMPMSFVFNLEERVEGDEDDENDDKKRCYVGFYLAPRIDDDEYY